MQCACSNDPYWNLLALILKSLFQILVAKCKSFIIFVHQGCPTFFSRGTNLLFQKFRGPKFGLTLSYFIVVISEKKRSSLRFDRFFLPKVDEDQKKKVYTDFCHSQRQRGSINQPTNAETFGGLL